jgi:Protein of unknown function, DUF488
MPAQPRECRAAEIKAPTGAETSAPTIGLLAHGGGRGMRRERVSRADRQTKRLAHPCRQRRSLTLSPDMPLPVVVWTVGHSNHEFDDFAQLVLGERIEFLVDVRSFPYSRYAPQFNREELRAAMTQRGVRYLFLGEELGGRPTRDEHYDDEGHALYGPMSEEQPFKAAVDRLLDGARRHRIALVCSEGDPHNCHRRLLVGKVLTHHGVELRHILPDGTVRPERSVALHEDDHQRSLFGDNEDAWRSTQSVSHRRRLSASSGG